MSILPPKTCYFGGILCTFKGKLQAVTRFYHPLIRPGRRHKDRCDRSVRQRLRIPGFFDIPTHPERVGDRKHRLRWWTHPQDFGKVRPPLFRAGLPGKRAGCGGRAGPQNRGNRLHAFR